ncbi:hypothetical protein GCM10010172_60440 [Paractinoplanes ferrugineus]|uniref:Uncharacterized protein n=1 Tax=Paractinoplanes ferrugineus TaxID=113564 RepID=A0A919MGA7_9ACTN|nr:hypothetical protein [Actinoplanes ferrugineus]GIE14628.1 hypothetical protein Afe05nite_64680 [Actinoplanes ferrugineus]
MTVVRRLLGVAGVLLIAYATVGALTDADLNPIGVLVFLAAVLILHDAVWMPAVLAVLALLKTTVNRAGRKEWERSRGRGHE